jgi:putative ABC transport system substrate-binding protein
MLMRRREFIARLGAAGAYAGVPRLVRAQQGRAMRRVAVLAVGDETLGITNLAMFRNELAKLGWVEGRNLRIDFRFSGGNVDRTRANAVELVSLGPDVIVALDNPSIVAAKSATSTIPIVFVTVSDPIKRGWVASLSRPGDNMTGVGLLYDELTQKRLHLLREMAPLATIVACLSDPRIPGSEELRSGIVAAADALGRQAIILEARNQPEIDAAFVTLAERGAGALLVTPAILFLRNGKKIIELAARHKIPAIYPARQYVVAGGLMSYGSAIPTLGQIVALYVAQILGGAKPADLPVQRATKFSMVINLKTAKALGLTISPMLLAIADEVIE